MGIDRITHARLNSKFNFTYGRLEVRAKLPYGDGTWPAIWMLGTNIGLGTILVNPTLLVGQLVER